MTISWIEFWNGETTIYVSARHAASHYERVASEIVAEIHQPTAHVLDYGSGAALSADRVAAACERLYLIDSAETIRENLRMRFTSEPKVHVYGPDEFDRILDGTIDLFVVNSVIQYMSRAALADALPQWRLKLTRSGRLILADVIPPEVTARQDAAALLKYAASNGFLLDASAGLVRTFFSKYRRYRAELGLQTYTEADLIQMLGDAGYRSERLPRNFGHNDARMAFLATSDDLAPNLH